MKFRLVAFAGVVSVLLVGYFSPTFFGIVDLNPGIAKQGFPIAVLCSLLLGILFAYNRPGVVIRDLIFRYSILTGGIAVLIKAATSLLDAHPPGTALLASVYSMFLVAVYILFVISLCLLSLLLITKITSGKSATSQLQQ